MIIVPHYHQPRSMIHTKWIMVLFSFCVVLTSPIGLGDDSPKAASETAEKEKNARDEVTGVEEQESRSLAFVEQHHPELVALLQLLKSMKHAEYKNAIREIAKVRKKIETLEKRNAAMAAIELDSWKIQSQIDLFLAKAVTQGKDVDAELLRSLVERRIEIDKKRLKAERDLLESRQKSFDEMLRKLEGHEAERATQQVNGLLKQIESKTNKPNKNKPVERGTKNP